MLKSLRAPIVISVFAVAGLLIAMSAPPAGSDPRMMLAAGIGFFAISLWATAVVSEYLTAMIFFALATITQVAPPSVIFSAFHSNAVWLVFGGLILGVAADRTGVGRWIAAQVVSRVGTSYSGILIGVIVGGAILGFLIPSSMGRMLLLWPVVKGLANEAGFDKGDRGYAGLVCALVLGTYLLPATILPANVPNVIMLGLAETLFDTTLTYGAYLKSQFPIIGLLRTIIGFFVIKALFPATAKLAQEIAEPVVLSRQGRVLLALLCLTVVLWMTDSIHGVSPGWVSLAAASICMLPGVGFVSDDDFRTRVSFGAIIYTAGTIAVGAVVTATGFDNWLGAMLQNVMQMEPGNNFFNYVAIVLTSELMCVLLTMGGVVPVLAPVAQDFAAASGFSVLSVLMMIAIGHSTPLLPYQSGPVVLIIRVSGVTFSQMTRFILPMGIITVVLLVPLNYLWWQFIGAIG